MIDYMFIVIVVIVTLVMIVGGRLNKRNRD